MTLEYRILWIDDDPDSVDTKKGQVKDYLEIEKGFDCKITPVNSYKDYVAKYDSSSTINDFDLLIVDFKLDNQENPSDTHSGFDIIQDIRTAKNIYTEIIFYSSHYDNLITTIKSPENYIEGVFTSPRNELQDKAQEIIDVLIKKVQNVNNLRGLIMAEVAELDRIKNRIVKKYCELTNNSDNELKKYIKSNVFSDFKSNLEKYDFLISEDENSHEKMKLHEFIDDLMYMSTKKSQTVFKIKRLYEPTKSLDFNHDNYYTEVIKKRNVFAHEEEQTRKDGSKFLYYTNKTPLEFTQEHCVQIRKDIKKHKELLDKIEQKLNE